MNLHVIEIIAMIAGFLNLYFITRASMWNWLFGMIAVTLYFIIFYVNKLYADALLQLFYLAIQFYGFYCWQQKDITISITNIPKKAQYVGVVTFIILDICFIFFLKNFTDSTTVMLDAFTTSISLVAQWMMIRKWLQHWWWWMIANVIAIDMYMTKSLYFTCALYTVFLLFNVYGYFRWKKLTLSVVPA